MDETFSLNQYKNNLTTYDNILKIATGQGDDDAPGCLLHYN